MQTILFWAAFGLACAWLLPQYYDNRPASRTKELRVATLVIDVLVILSFNLTWIPASRGGPVTGLAVIAGGDALLATAALCVIAAAATFAAAKNAALLKLGAMAHILATVLLFAAMLRALPGTFSATLAESAPMGAMLLLLCGNVSTLLFWHRLQQSPQSAVRSARSAAIASILLVPVLGYTGWFFLHRESPHSSFYNSPAAAVEAVRSRPEVQEYLRRVPDGRVDINGSDADGYLIQVYELKDGHTATFNWYTVGPRNGTAEAMFDVPPDE